MISALLIYIAYVHGLNMHSILYSYHVLDLFDLSIRGCVFTYTPPLQLQHLRLEADRLAFLRLPKSTTSALSLLISTTTGSVLSMATSTLVGMLPHYQSASTARGTIAQGCWYVRAMSYAVLMQKQ